MNVIGIDPGISGAIALLRGSRVDIWDMPVYLDGKSKYVDTVTLAEILNSATASADLVVVEKVRSMPKQGVSSTFKFGHAFGAVLGCSRAYCPNVVETPPREWKGAMGLTSSKELSLRLARKLWPLQADELFKLKKHDGRAEAALLAQYGRDFLTGD